MRSGWLAVGAVAAAAGVALGAFGAHGLASRVGADRLQVFETAVRYQIYHAFGLVVVAWARTRWPGRWTAAAGWLFLAGIVVFSGSLYLLVLTGARWLGAITPLGGVSFIAGWLALARAALSAR
jgi:uncharacterized membrane protein YgdD (TMEM256/DUF423 family)